jgi:hypothetical protein
MKKEKEIYLLFAKNAEAGTMETMPLTTGMTQIEYMIWEKEKSKFKQHDKVCITSEACLEVAINTLSDPTKKAAIKVLKDKHLFRKLLTNIYPDYHYKALKAEDIVHLSLDKKMVLKPIKGCFGTGVRTVDAHTNLTDLYTEIQAELAKNSSILSENVLSKNDFLLEQYIEGEEYAVDMFYNGAGEPCIVNIYHHPLPQNEAYLHVIYYTSQAVFEAIYNKAKQFFIILNKKLNVTNMPLHAEFKLDKNDLKPIEINAMRFGGMGLGNLVFHALNINPYEYFMEDREPDWKTIWQDKNDAIFAYFIAYNAATKSTQTHRPIVKN